MFVALYKVPAWYKGWTSCEKKKAKSLHLVFIIAAAYAAASHFGQARGKLSILEASAT